MLSFGKCSNFEMHPLLLIKKGIGTYENDRPPVQGFFGRTTKQIRLAVCLGARIDQIQPKVENQT